MNARKLAFLMFGTAILQTGAMAQIPDLLTSFDAGGRAMGMGGSIGTAGADTTSALSNPAGLAHQRKKSVAINLRNFPSSNTTMTGTFVNPVRSTATRVGGLGISHFGLVIPLGDEENPRGTVGLSYTVGGFVRDERVSSGSLVIDANSAVSDYKELLKNKTEYFTASYGTGSADNSFTYGIGLVLAQNYVLNRQSYSVSTNGQAAVQNPPLNISGTGFGVGAVAGFQIVPSGNPNLSLGLSVRTPINLSGNGSTAAYYDTIPGRISAGFAYRKDGLRGGRDYAVIGGQVDTFFKNERNVAMSRKRTVNVGAGVEYNMLRGQARIPFRMGVNIIPAGGYGFRDRNAITFGVGYRPFNKPYAVDLNIASPTTGGGMDAAIGFTFKLK